MQIDHLPKTYASIDIGTNTITILIVEYYNNTINVLFEDEYITMLGEGLSKTNRVNGRALNRCLKALLSYKAVIKRYCISDVFCVATSAMRRATNQKQVLSEINNCGFYPKVITGKEEAKYVGRSIEYEFPNLTSNALCVDVGGGSTELILFHDKKIKKIKSLNIGTIILTENFFYNDPPKSNEITSCKNFILSNLKQLKIEIQCSDMFIGVGGTATTLCAIHKGLVKYDSKKIHKSILYRKSLNQIKILLYNKNINEKKKIPGLQLNRAWVIQAGFLILSTIMDFFHIQKLVICDRGLRWGVLRKNLKDNF